MSNSILVTAGVDADNNPYVIIDKAGVTVCIPKGDFVVGSTAFVATAKAQGLILTNSSDAKFIRDRVNQLDEQGSTRVVSRPGWNGDIFVLPDGDQFTLPNGETGVVGFPTDRLRVTTNGTLKDWQKLVAEPLRGQSLAIFALAMAFLPPLLRFMPHVKNFSVELTGRPGSGKSTLQYLMASVIGGIGLSSGKQYWSNLATTTNALDMTLSHHSDLPLILDETNLLGVGAGANKVTDLMRDLAFKIAEGTPKRRMGAEQVRVEAFRTVALLSSNKSVRELLGSKDASAHAVADRILTIPIPEDWPYGVYQSLPMPHVSPAAYAQSLLEAALNNHGHGFRQFMTKLMEALQDNEAFRAKLDQLNEDFMRRVAPGTEGSDHRVASAFAAVYVAGRMARTFGALPKTMNIRRAVLECYRLHLGVRISDVPFPQRLKAVLGHPDIVYTPTAAGDTSQVKAVRRQILGQELLLIRSSSILHFFPDWEDIKKRADVHDRLRRKGRETQLKASLLKGMKSEWLFGFKLDGLLDE